jgi:hypothetical protein
MPFLTQPHRPQTAELSIIEYDSSSFSLPPPHLEPEMESKCRKINAGKKTKVKVGGEGLGKVEVTCKYPCGVCGKGVGRNSLQCCEKWINKRCSGVKGNLQKAIASFECRTCKGRQGGPIEQNKMWTWVMGLTWKRLESSVTWATC